MSKPIDAFGPPVALTAASPREGTSGAAARADHDHSTAGLGGGGGGGGTGFDRRWNVGASETSIDEFNTGMLSGSWVRVDAGGGTSRATWTEAADVLSVYNSGGDAAGELHAMMIPISAMSAGDAFVIAQTLTGPPISNFSMSGLLLADGVTYNAGKQVVAFYDISSTGYLNIDLRSYTGYNANPGTVDARSGIVGVLYYTRLVMTTANTWRHDTSIDGVSWINGAATLSYTMTPTYVGVMTSSWGSSNRSVASYEFLRRVSGVS